MQLVFKSSNPTRKTVELPAQAAPSRIRREPPPPPKVVRRPNEYPTEREAWTVAIGVVMFAVALAIIIIGVSDFTS